MPSVVSGQGSEGDILEQAIALELDCIAAYTAAAERLGEAKLRVQVAGFAQANQQRLSRLRQRQQACALPSTGANVLTRELNRGKVAVTSWVSDKAVLHAIVNNAQDSHQAYTEVAARVELSAACRQLFAELAADAGAQLAWFRQQGL